MDVGTSYPVLDSLQNLRIRVNLERVLSAGGGTLPSFSAFISESRFSQATADERREEEEVEEYTFRWQEKIFSQRELRKYSNEANCTTPLEQQYHRDVTELRSRGALPTVRLFTYIDGDDFKSAEEAFDALTISDANKTQNSYLAERMANVRHRRIAPQSRLIGLKNPVVDVPSEEAIKKSHTLPHSSLTMHIMAYLGPKDSEPTQEGIEMDERIICTIRLINDKLLWINPDFSRSNKPYRVEGKIGVFQFTLTDVSAKPSKEALVSHRKRDLQLQDYKTNFLKSQVGTEFDVPEDGVFKMLILGEILSAKDFEYDNLYVHYLVELPKGWYAAGTTKSLQGNTHFSRTSVIDKDNVGHFGFPIELNLCYNMSPYDPDPAELLPKWPQLLLEVGSVDSWNRHRTEGYGFLTFPTRPGQHKHSIETWRPVESSPQGELRRFFIGGTPELESLKVSRIPKHFQGNILSKVGLETVSSGSVDLRFNVLHQCRSFISEDRQRQLRYGSILEKIGARSGMHSSIIGVLESFQKARQRMLIVRENLLVDKAILEPTTASFS